MSEENRWHPSGCDNAARLVRNRIAELELWTEFYNELADLSSGQMIQSTARQQCIAALKAIDGSARQGGIEA